MPALELKVPPLALTAITLVLISAAGLVAPMASLAFAGHAAAAAIVAGAGLAVMLGAAAQFRLRRTTLDPRAPGKARHFVATGLYRISRNPMYLGMALMVLGAALWASEPISYLLVALFCAYLTEFQIKPEERILEARFGPEYLAFKARVRRWL